VAVGKWVAAGGALMASSVLQLSGASFHEELKTF